MTMDADITRLKLQEQVLRFLSLDEDQAWKLGSAMRERALERHLPLVIDIRIGQRPLFYCALPGTTPENHDWVRRKINTVYRFEACSYRVALEHALKKNAFDESRGVRPIDHALAGGGFPIRLAGNVVGAVTVSGIPQRDDHNFVAESLAAHLGIPYADIALASETP
jgi:uncharacterized protein (UPF0303 family)